MRAKHLGEGLSELGGQKVIVKNGEARLENGALAGSVLKMNDAIKNVVTKLAFATEAIYHKHMREKRPMSMDAQ